MLWFWIFIVLGMLVFCLSTHFCGQNDNRVSDFWTAVAVFCIFISICIWVTIHMGIKERTLSEEYSLIISKKYIAEEMKTLYVSEDGVSKKWGGRPLENVIFQKEYGYNFKGKKVSESWEFVKKEPNAQGEK